MTHTASCSCGQLKVEYAGEITRSAVCHCYACQRRTGSVFGAQVALRRELTTVTGQSTTWVRVPEDGGTVEFHFCPICGSTVFWQIDDMTDRWIVAVGAFADRDFPAPVFSVYEDHMHRWVILPETVTEHMD